MTKLDKLLNLLIQGSRNSWYYQFELGVRDDIEYAGGSFYRRADARKHLKNQLRQTITNDHVLEDYLQLRSQTP